jgi:hypothetical protein
LPWFFLATVRPIAVGAPRSGRKRPIAPGPIALLSKSLAARPICPLVGEFFALKARRSARLALLPTVAATMTVIAVEARTAIFAMRHIRLVKCGIRLSGTGFFAASLGKAPLFEFFRSSRAVFEAFLAASRTFRPPPKIVVFVVIAGHERTHFGKGQTTPGFDIRPLELDQCALIRKIEAHSLAKRYSLLLKAPLIAGLIR